MLRSDKICSDQPKCAKFAHFMRKNPIIWINHAKYAQIYENLDKSLVFYEMGTYWQLVAKRYA